MREATKLKVTSHVGRDLLQSAASFKTDYAVVWEYVVNSLQYMDDGIAPRVQVLIHSRNKEIEIIDNGRGLSSQDLSRFFQMHAENLDRVRGRAGRGKFGTGKSAAFGIGRFLRVDTRSNGNRNVVMLTREAVDSSKGDEIPIDWSIRNEATSLANGTTITIGQIALPKINNQAIIEYIERHLQAYRAQTPEVAVNDHVCEYREPNVSESLEFAPSPEQAKIIGDAKLVVKVSLSPLPETEIGIAITAGPGNFVAVETGGVDRKELGNYLFGEIDVPALETTKSTVEPYDATRSLLLNPQHPVCAALIPFIGAKLEEVRAKQVRRLAEARKSEQSRRLSSEADRIAEVLNQDFQRMAGKLHGIRAVTAASGFAGARFGGGSSSDDSEDAWKEGTAVPGVTEKADNTETNTIADRTKTEVKPAIQKSGTQDDNGKAAVDPAGGQGRKSRPRGGFRVEYRELGRTEDRSKYDKTTLTILINLDHPAVKNALKSGGVSEPNFKRLSYEIAFTEYSIALGYEFAERDPDLPAEDLLYEVRATLNRIAASAAALYAD